MPHNLPPDRASAMGRKSVQTRRMQAVEKRIKALVDSAPPLSPEQVSRLTAALRRGSAAEVA